MSACWRWWPWWGASGASGQGQHCPLYVPYMYLFGRDEYNLSIETSSLTPSTVVPANSDSGVVLCLQLLSRTLTRTFYLSWGKSIDHLCINPILRIGLIHKWSIDYKSLITLWTGHEVTVTLGLQDSSYFLACDSCCRLLVAFANGLDPDWDRWQNVGPGLVPCRLTLWPCSCANILEGLILIKVGRRRRLLKMIQQGGS